MTYGCIAEDHMMLFSDLNLFQHYQTSLANNRLLKQNKSFTEYVYDNLSLECNYFYFEDSELMKAHNINSILNSEVLWAAENPTSRISITARNYKNAVQVRLNASHSPPKANGIENTPNSLWSFKADSIIKTKAHIFVNHITKENELCFQDKSGLVYLINATGNLIWKKRITEDIQSEIYTVDIFKNGKLQLLFNTQNYLHLLDRNGNYVQGFPIRLPAKVTSNLTVLDYDGKKDYRLFIACADKRIYNFSLYGIKTEGFTPVKTDAEVIEAIQYVKVGPSDYLITVDVAGKIYAFSRKGEGRIDFKNRVIEHLEHLLVLPGSNLDNTKLVYVDDKNSLLNKISLSDKKEALKIGDELTGFKTSFGLLNDDEQTDLITGGDGALFVYDLFTGKLLEYIDESAYYDDVQMVHTSDQDLVMAFDKSGQKIDVINTSGKLSSTLPNATSKPMICDLYKNGKTYVLLINGNMISCRELQ
jgi:outer membrane protein assembly factor BamB